MSKQYSLTKQNLADEYDYIDQDGVSWSSPSNWFFLDILGGCGCGSSDEFAQRAVDLLRYFGSEQYRDERPTAIPPDDEWYELLAHWFDSLDLIEHGTVIMGSWLTEKGQAIYDILVAFERPLLPNNST